MCLLQHNLKCSGSVASPEVKGETDFLLVVFPSPLFFFFYSLFLLSQLPNISFDVLCWDFKRTLSTWAGVGFSEQARVPHSSRGASGSRTFLPGLVLEQRRPRSFPFPEQEPRRRLLPGPGPAERASSPWGGACAPGLSPVF